MHALHAGSTIFRIGNAVLPGLLGLFLGLSGLLATARPAGAGTFRVLYVSAMTSGSAQWEQGLREVQLLEQFAAALNEFLHIPVDLTLALADCEQPNALYRPQRRTVTVCYQLLQHFASV